MNNEEKAINRKRLAESLQYSIESLDRHLASGKMTEKEYNEIMHKVVTEYLKEKENLQ